MAVKTLKVRFDHISSDDFTDALYYETPAEYRRHYEKYAVKMQGQQVYVVTSERPRATHPTYTFRATPGRTNLSHEERVKGWLGSTDNVNRYALGRYEVTGHSSTHLHLREVANEA